LNEILPKGSLGKKNTYLCASLELNKQNSKKMDAIKFVQEQYAKKLEYPAFRAGDNVAVNYKIIEGDKERIQIFRGNVIQIKGKGATKTFTVRKISGGVGVERIFPIVSPNITEIQVLKRGKVRRARLFYLRDAIGQKARIKEKKFIRPGKKKA
jgi:large subunit ribosomal protein L19